MDWAHIQWLGVPWIHRRPSPKKKPPQKKTLRWRERGVIIYTKTRSDHANVVQLLTKGLSVRACVCNNYCSRRCSKVMWLTHNDVQSRGHRVVGADGGEADTVCWPWKKPAEQTSGPRGEFTEAHVWVWPWVSAELLQSNEGSASSSTSA